jgi:hypothetical protein
MVIRHTPASGPIRAHAVGGSRWAVRLAAAALAGPPVAIAWYFAWIAIDGPHAVDDNWRGVVIGLVMLAAFLLAIAAFVLAVAARRDPGRPRSLWLAFSALPMLLAFVILGERFWWE